MRISSPYPSEWVPQTTRMTGRRRRHQQARKRNWRLPAASPRLADGGPLPNRQCCEHESILSQCCALVPGGRFACWEAKDIPPHRRQPAGQRTRVQSLEAVSHARATNRFASHHPISSTELLPLAEPAAHFPPQARSRSVFLVDEKDVSGGQFQAVVNCLGCRYRPTRLGAVRSRDSNG